MRSQPHTDALHRHVKLTYMLVHITKRDVLDCFLSGTYVCKQATPDQPRAAYTVRLTKSILKTKKQNS